MNLADRVAVVTGGAHRVGGAITRALAERGAAVAIHYGTSSDAADALADEIRSSGGRAVTVQANLADRSAPTEIFDAAAELGPVTVLVNSAAGFPTDRLGQLDRDAYQRVMTVNLDSPIWLTNEFAARLPDNTEGAVVNVTDWRIERPYGDHFSYLIAKGALATMTRAAAIHLAPRVRVNAVALGAILPPPGEDEDYLEELAKSIPLRRTGGTEPVVSAVLELLTNHFVTGQIWRLDGGASLA